MAKYIEKQAAIDAVNSVPAANWVRKRYTGELERIPPVDVRPVVRGRWRKIGNNSDGTSDYECSACLGIMMHVPDDDEHPLVSFCSMCGADMRDEEPVDKFEGWSDELKQAYREMLEKLDLLGVDAE